MDVFRWAGALARHRAAAAVAGAAPVAAAVVLCVVVPPRYTSGFSVVAPDAGTDLVRTIAGAGADGVGSWVVPEIVGQDDFLYDVGRRRFPVWRGGRVVLRSLADEAGARGRASVTEAARARVRAAVDEMGGVIRVAVTTRDPQLSARAAEYVLGRLEARIDASRDAVRRSAAAYYAARLREARNAVEVSEDRLRAFLERNRGWMVSRDPATVGEIERRRREHEVLTAAYVDLLRRREVEELASVTLVPPLEVLDRPAVPRLKSGPKRAVFLIVGAAAGGVLALLAGWVLEVRRARRRLSPSFVPRT